MPNQRFTDHLRQLADSIWRAQHEHPFIRGIGDGTLDVEKFKFWVRQDYLFLIDYARTLLLAAAKSPDLPTMTRFAELASATLNVEMDLHRSYAEEFDISGAELEAEEKSPTTQAYTDFLLRSAAIDDFLVTVAALLPCFWGFSEIGQRLSLSERPRDERYAKWIDMYSTDEFAELAQWCRDLLDRLAVGMSESSLQQVAVAFIISSRYECQFWDMAYKQERWPL